MWVSESIRYARGIGIELGVLRPQGLSWRPYVTLGMLAIITLGLVCFFVLLICRLLRGLKNRSIGIVIVLSVVIKNVL